MDNDSCQEFFVHFIYLVCKKRQDSYDFLYSYNPVSESFFYINPAENCAGYLLDFFLLSDFYIILIEIHFDRNG